jgi:cell fate regulator YaaT (PSP1 superfamily)
MNIVQIRLRKPRRVLPAICGDLALHRDEPCIVQTDRGPEWGVCILPPEPCPQEMESRYPSRVLRKVNFRDEETYRWMVAEEKKAVEVCKRQIELHRLPMKLVDAEYTFDKRKIVFFFTADDRVDFRELVRDLAHDLRVRIELRHIQVRDEAKMVGGIGGCGRELCCTTWLNDFKPISMRMAKKQNLALNPSKISGQCGRLLCCLAYENEQYEMMKRQARQLAQANAAEEDLADDDAADDAPATLPAAPRPAERPAPRPAPAQERPPQRMERMDRPDRAAEPHESDSQRRKRRRGGKNRGPRQDRNDDGYAGE